MKQNESKSLRRWAGISGLAALLCTILLLVPGLRAEDDAAGTPPAARAVRLSNVEGEVHLSQGDQVLADQALANTPLFEGARIETGNGGRAEVQFEDGSVVRISPQSSLTITALRGSGAGRDSEIQLNSGLAYFEVQGETDSNHMRVRFDDTVVTATGFTVLRINFDQAPGEVAVFSGNAHLEGGAAPALDLHGGESVALNATDPASSKLAETIEPNSWDAWNSDRDQELNAAAGNRTEATNSLPDHDNPAWNDLDANGNWYNVPDQGYVWSPNEASNSDWDPYGNGYWMDSPGYGYMWVSGEPWGYMPYQCGAWNYYNRFGWGWAPGMCNPWWGGYGGWLFNIGFAPPRYRYPHRPRPRDPRPADRPRPLIAVNRNGALGNTTLAPRDRTGTVMIGGHLAQPLRPVGINRQPVPVISTRQQPSTPTSPVISRPVYGLQMGSRPQPVITPGGPRPGGSFTPPPSHPGGTYTPAPVPRSSPAPVYHPAPAPRSAPSAPSAPHSSGGGGGAVHSGGGGGGGGGGHSGGGGGPHR